MVEDLSWIPENGVHMDNDWNLVYPKEASHLDSIDEELRGLIDDHGAQFPPQHPMVNVCGGLLYLTLSIINYVGNGIVLYVFLKVCWHGQLYQLFKQNNDKSIMLDLISNHG